MAHRYGWVRDLPDQRDFKFVIGRRTFAREIDWRHVQSPVYDQGQLGSCVYNAGGAGIDFLHQKKGEGFIYPSRLFPYYNGRALEGTVSSDSGTTIRDGIKVYNKFGVCPETEWPYIIKKFTVKPPKKCYADAKQEELIQYTRLNSTLEMKVALSAGFCFIGGIAVYESFEGPGPTKTGIIPMPGTDEALLGGHALWFVGYKLIKGVNHFIFKNSWGLSWGDQGYGYIPEKYLANPDLSSDFWELQKLTK